MTRLPEFSLWEEDIELISRGERVSGGLGLDVVRSQLIAALSVSGVYRVNLVSPNADIVVPENGWAHATAQTVTLAGVENG